MQKRDVLSSPRLRKFQKQRNRTARNKILVFVAGFVLIFLALGFGSQWKKINIVNVEITGEKTVGSEVIEKTIKDKLSGKYLFIFSKTNFLIYPQNDIARELAQKFTRLKDIKVSLKDISTLTVSMNERVASYIWCGNTLPDPKTSLTEEKCFFLDKNGFIFDEAPYFSGDVYFRFFGEISRNSENILGLYYFPEIFNGIMSFKKNMEEMGLNPTSLFIKENGDIDIYLASNTLPPNSQKILLTKDSDLEQAAENLQTALTTEPLKTDFKNKYSSLQYIDLRFGNKVYYRFK